MSEEEAHDAFVAIRFAETEGEPYCIKCGCAVVYHITRKVRSKATGNIRLRKLFKCAECLRQFSVTSDTSFQDRKMEFRDILFAIALYANGAKGMSALQISRDLRVQVKTAFVLLHKVREALSALQQAVVFDGSRETEIDGAYYGGYVKPSTRQKNRRDRRKLANQSGKRKCIVVVRERNGRSRPFVCSELEGTEKVQEVLPAKSILYADEAKAYDNLEAIFDLRRIDHSKSYAEGINSTNWAESGHSRMKRSQMGIHHHFAGPYLQAYADEMAWRDDNRRVSNGHQFVTMASAGLHHPKSPQWRGYWQRHRKAP